jgi:tripartite ATP-independent transporter DctM subunit
MAEVFTFIMFGALIASIFLGFPIAFTLSGVAIICGLIAWGPIVFSVVGYQITQVMLDFALITVPLFVFMGCMMERAGVADTAFAVLDQWLRKVKGGLGMATSIIGLFFASCIGVVGAAVTTLGTLSLAPMLNRGYDKGLASGHVAASGTLGILLPPSVVLVVFSPVAGVSMIKIFIASIVPGLLLGLFYTLYVGLVGYFKKGMVPEVAKSNAPREYTLWQGIAAFVPFMCLIFFVLGSIMAGIVVPMDAAAVGALGSIVLVVGYKKFSIKFLVEAALSTLRISTMVIFVTLGAYVFTAVFFGIGCAQVIRRFVESSNLGPNGTFAVFLVLVFALGIFVDWLGVTLIMVPIFMPLFNEFGFDPLYISIVTLVLLQTSFLTPPFAFSIFYIKGIAPPDVSIGAIYKGVVPFICIQLFVVMICIFFPAVITFLPDILITGWV